MERKSKANKKASGKGSKDQSKKSDKNEEESAKGAEGDDLLLKDIDEVKDE